MAAKRATLAQFQCHELRALSRRRAQFRIKRALCNVPRDTQLIPASSASGFYVA